MERLASDFPEPELRWMWRLARALVCDAGAADDLVQDAWIELARRGEEPERPRPFVAGLLRRLASRKRRGEQRRAARERGCARVEALQSSSELSEQLEVHERLVAALKEMREPLRATLFLRYYGELSAAEIARRAGVPAATVRARLQRGLAELRRELDERAGGRDAWLGALAPWVARQGAPWLGAVLIGGVAMKAIAVAGAAALAGIAYLAWAPRESADGEGLARASDAKEELAARELAPRTDVDADERVAIASSIDTTSSDVQATATDATELGPRTRVELRVLDLARRPVAGARVQAFGGRPLGDWWVGATGTSDADGRLALESRAGRERR